MQRLFPVAIEPGAVTDANFVLISHAHLDHCDFSTVLPLAKASAKCMIICPNEVAQSLKERGISEKRLIAAREEWITLGEQLRVMSVPAAHTEIERDTDGLLRYVGYVIEYQDRRIYHAGDTSPAITAARSAQAARAYRHGISSCQRAKLLSRAARYHRQHVSTRGLSDGDRYRRQDSRPDTLGHVCAKQRLSGGNRTVVSIDAAAL